MHSLLGAPALVVDLLHSSAGPAVAADLSRALLLGPEHLAALTAGFADGPTRRGAWEEIRLGASLVERLDTVVAAVGEVERRAPGRRGTGRGAGAGGANGAGGAGGAGGRLRQDLSPADRAAPDGPPGPAELVTLVRDDVLGWTWRSVGEIRVQTESAAVAAVCDAVVAAAERDRLSAPAYERLRRCWLRAPDLPGDEPGDLGPQSDLLHRLLERTAAAGVVQLCQLDAAMVDLHRNGRTAAWEQALEAAGWAATLTGRVRLTAVAQLALAAHWPVPDLQARRLLHAAVPAATGAVAALVCADLLDSGSTRRLLAVWESVFGPLAGPGFAS